MKNQWYLTTIIVLAALLYFFQLGRPDIITDESSLATRAIGLVDFDFGIEQPTPWQWVDKIPWWMRLSFHDHPPLVFLLQHWSIKLFGENPMAIRIPSALAGIASVIFVYLIGTQLYQRGLPPTVIARSLPKAGDEAISGARRGLQIATPRRMSGLAMTDDAPRFAALASALLFAVTANHVWISRIGLQESILIALMLASVWAFLKGLERPPWLPIAGLFLGLAFLAKYTAFIFIPIFAAILFLYRKNHNSVYKYDRNYKRKFLKNIIFAVLALLAVVSPVIIYNLQLYRSFGHFDFQFSLLFGQDVPAWQSRPGQEVLGSYADRVKNFIPWLINSNSPYFLILAALGLTVIVWEAIRHRSSRPLVISHWSLAIVLAWLLPFLVFIGPTPRFLTILTPWLALAAGYSLARFPYSQILKNLRIRSAVTAAGIIIFALIESAYSYNSVIALNPIGQKPWAYSHLRRQSHSWGFNELNKYLDETLKGKMPDPAITFEFPFAREILNQAVSAGKAEGRQAVSWAIVYDGNINLSAQLWVFLRRITYQGWPMADAETFRRGGAQEFFRDSGVKTIFFIAATDLALKDRPRLPAPDADLLEVELAQRGIASQEIKNARGEVAFRVYQFQLK